MGFTHMTPHFTVIFFLIFEKRRNPPPKQRIIIYTREYFLSQMPYILSNP